jgi:hypothetical protein
MHNTDSLSCQKNINRPTTVANPAVVTVAETPAVSQADDAS